MRALRFHAAHDLRIEDVAEPSGPGPGRGRRPRRRPAASAAPTCTSTSPGPIVTPVEPHPLTGAQNPQILGHEFAGDVVAVGAGRDARGRGRPRRDHAARLLRPLRLLPARAPAPVRDDGLRRALPRLGRHGRARDGRRVPDRPASRRRDATEQGALIEPTAVAAYGVERAGVAPGDRVLVTGAGPIGALAALCARSAGASSVYVSEPNPARRARAEALGVATVLDPTAVDVPEFLREQSDGLGVDVAIECSGHPQRLRRRASARCAGGARSRRRGCSSARRRSSRCSGRSTT